jgi:hypothetical protein
MDKCELAKVRDWANEKLATGDEPPWAWYRYMQLREALDAILSGMESVSPTARLQPPEPHQGRHLQLVGGSGPQGSVPHRPSDVPVQMPM